MKREDLPEGRFEELVHEHALTNEAIRAEARRRFDTMSSISADLLFEETPSA